MVCCEDIWWKLCRRKTLPKDLLSTPLNRCLNIFDLVMLGVGNMIGAGVFLLSGVIARDIAGPGVVLSYLLAGFAMFLTSLCYAEFGARVPKAGSAYTYTYMTLGEFWAFIVGWDVILERMLSAAAVARGWSSTLDGMFNGAIRNATITILGPVESPGLSEYLDFTSLALTLVILVVVSLGVKYLANTNSFFSLISIVTLLIVITIGVWKASWTNWTSEALGGFLPYGFQGVVAGVATLFYTYVGFESICTAGEETKDPATQIPIATIVAMLITTLIYTSTGAVLTLMTPFNQININSPFPSAFRSLGLDWAVYFVSVGAIIGITTSAFMDHFALSRTVYAMATDGLFFRIFAWVHPMTHSPLVATISFGIITAILALILEYKTLVEFLSIGTLMSFTMVAICVIINRYRPPDHINLPSLETDLPALIPLSDIQNITEDQSAIETPILKKDFTESRLLMRIPGEAVLYLSILAVIICTVILSLMFRFSDKYDIYGDDKAWAVMVMLLAMLGIITALFFMSAYEETNEPTNFAVPLVPYTPALSIMVNTALLVQLPVTAWYRYCIWLVLGLLIYFLYGIHHSSEKKPLAEATHTLMSYSSVDNTEYEETQQ